MIDFPTEPPDPIGIFAARRFRRALRRMLEAKAYATRTTCSLWEYAVELSLLRQIGLTENDLRYLVRSQYLEHAWEVSAAGRDAREFRSAGRLAFDERSCFVLTPRGARLASGALGKARSLVSSGVKTRAASNAAPALPLPRWPVWDAERRILFWQGRIVKRFRRHAANQGLVLGAFQEESWPLRIDDPLAPRPCQDMKRRLNDTIKCLNRGQVYRLLHFRGDGTGEGVLWEVVK